MAIQNRKRRPLWLWIAASISAFGGNLLAMTVLSAIVVFVKPMKSLGITAENNEASEA
ncbi:MAG: hypothetical protein ABTQ34_08900 [Bdellovibrionales bacterium]